MEFPFENSIEILDNDKFLSREIISQQLYYKKYTKDYLIALAEQPTVKHPNSPDEWMSNTIKLID